MKKFEANKRVRVIAKSLDTRATKQVQGLVDFCDRLTGEVMQINAPEETSYGDYAQVVCHIPNGITAETVRISDSTIGVGTKGRHDTLFLGADEVGISEYLKLKKQQGILDSYSFKPRVTIIDGKIPIHGFSAHIHVSGKHVNIEFGV